MNLLEIFAKLLPRPDRRDVMALPFALIIATLITAIIITIRWPEYKEAFKQQGIDHIDFLVWHIDMN